MGATWTNFLCLFERQVRRQGKSKKRQVPKQFLVALVSTWHWYDTIVGGLEEGLSIPAGGGFGAANPPCCCALLLAGTLLDRDLTELVANIIWSLTQYNSVVLLQSLLKSEHLQTHSQVIFWCSGTSLRLAWLGTPDGVLDSLLFWKLPTWQDWGPLKAGLYKVKRA